jgi:hypothetical protein
MHRTTLKYLFVFALFLGGCKAKPGDKCDSAQAATCEDRATALACREGVLVSAPCRGPSGCAKGEERAISCDDSFAVEGEACIGGDHESRACSTDHAKSLLCDLGKWRAVQRCTGAKACTVDRGAVSCDVRGAATSDPCPGPGTFACAPDSRSRLACKDGKFQFDRFCKGQAGCRDHDLACDQSIAGLGDTCGLPGALACGSDGRTELICQGGAFAVRQQCAGGGCQVAGNGGIDCPQ